MKLNSIDLIFLDSQLLEHCKHEADELADACLAYFLWLKELTKQAGQQALKALAFLWKAGKMLLENYRLPFTTLKYCFDLYYANLQESSEHLKIALHQPEVLLALALLGSVSLLLSFFNETQGSFSAWPYARDAIKHLRNVYRGLQNSLNLIYLLELADLTELIIPLSLVLGLISITNRVWYRYQSQARESLIIQGKEVLASKSYEERLQALNSLLTQIQAQKQEKAMLASAILNGFMEGIHAYLGFVTLVYMSTLALSLVASFACLYFVLSLGLKIYAELEARKDLLQVEREIQQCLQPSLGQDLSSFLPLETQGVLSSFFKGCQQSLTAYAFIVVHSSITRFIFPYISPLSALDRSVIGLSFLALGSLSSLGSYYFSDFEPNQKKPAGCGFFDDGRAKINLPEDSVDLKTACILA